MNTTLVIMAAGIGSRFGGGIKQLEPVGPNGEIIMDYSIYDAIEAGFNKIIFVIRKDIENDFRSVIGDRISSICSSRGVNIAYAFQELDSLPNGYHVPDGRSKPWGTGQAVLACKDFIHEPFAVINADDYYGKEAFHKLHAFLQSYSPNAPTCFCMAGFLLKNTLSENGAVTRGVCCVNSSGFLTDIVETSNIIKNSDGSASADGRVIESNTPVSMNMWGLTPDFLPILEQGFCDFLQNLSGNEQKAEYLLPIFIGELLQQQAVSVQVLPTSDQWFGVTYLEDKPTVAAAFQKLIANGVYCSPLYS